MSKIERNVVNPPNEQNPGDRRSNSYLPLVGTLSSGIFAANASGPSDRLSASMPIMFEPSAVKLPDQHFRIAEVGPSESCCGVAPGHGLIPVDPLSSSTGIIDDKQFVKSATPVR